MCARRRLSGPVTGSRQQRIFCSFAKPVFSADALDDSRHLAFVRRSGEVRVAKALLVVGHKGRKVLPNEAQVGRTGARLEEERAGGKEARTDLPGAVSHAVQCLFRLCDSW